MKSRDESEDQFINELTEMRRRVGELEATAAKLRGTEKALRESEERFRLLYENVPLGYQSLDENGHFLEVNQAWLDTLGYSREEVVGKWFGDFLAPGYQDHFKINFPKFKAAGEIHWVEFEMLRKDGSQITVAFDGQIGRDERGRFKQTHCILHDITERKLAEEARERSERIFRQMFEGSRAVKLLIDPESGELIDANPAAADFYGYTVDDLKRLKITDINTLAPEQIFAEMTKAKTKQRQHFFFKHRLGSGEIRDVEVHSSPLDLGDKRILYSIIHDITERKMGEEALARANEDWERTFKAISDGIMVLNSEHKILRANKAMADALGMTESELIGKSCFKLVHGTKGPPAFCPHSQLLVDGEEHRAEVLEPRLGATLDVRVSPIFDQNHKVIGSVHVVRDITERKRAEEALRESEEKYKTLFEESFDGLFITSPAGKILDMNKTGIGMFGYDTKAEILRLDLERDVYAHPLDRRRILSMVNAQGSAEYEVVVKKKNGEHMITQCSLAAVRDEQGVITTYRGIIRDITDRKRIEAALQDSEERLRLTLEATQIGIWDWDVKTDQWYASPMYYAMLGYEPKTELGDRREWLERVHPDDRAYVNEKIQDVLARDAKDYRYEARLRHADGTYRWQHVQGVSVKRDEDGKVTRMLGIRMDMDERKRAEEALRASEEVHRVTISSISDAVFITDDNEALTYVCPNTHLIFGYSQEEVEALGKVSALLGHELHDAFQRGNQQEIHNVDCAIKDKFGKRRALLVNVKRVDIKGGTILYTCRDITDRKQAEESLREANAFLDTLLNAIPAPVFYKGTDDRYLGCNKSFEDFYGKTRQELIGKTVFDIAPRELAEVYHAKDLEVFRTPGVQVYGSQIKDFSGTVHDVLFHKATFSDPQGNVLGLVGVMLDITERKQAEEKSLRLAEIVESSDDAIFGKTPDGAITSWNKGASKIYGYQDAEVLGKPISLLVPPDRQAEVLQLLERIKRGEHIEHYETVGRKIDGRDIDVSLTISPIRNAQGEVVGASTIARDITEQKSLQRQLLHAQKMEALGTLAGGIAHDFNNLLTVVLGFSELLLIGKDERDPSYADLQKIHQAARSGADLVQRILAFSRKTEINPRPLNLNHEIEQAKKLLTRAIPKMIEIELALSDQLATVNADPVQIEQILMNLTVNAKDAMPDGGKLTIETKNVALDEEYCRMHLGSKAGDYVLLSLSDTGHGMDRETLKHIFEPFYTTKGIGRGTGLGLAIVYGIVKQHGGYITCYSEPGMGTTFKIYLPVIPADAKAEAPTTVKHVLPIGRERILLVDDDEFVRDFGKRILERSGYTVLTAAKARDALDLYKRERDKISLVILDLIMPEMGGKECLEGLLKIDPRVKVVIASGYAAEGQARDTIEAGARGFIGKPYDMKQMLQAVREVLDSD